MKRVVTALVLFGIAFGYVEAAVVVYLRALDEPIRAKLFAGVPHDEVFPLLPISAWGEHGSIGRHIIVTELGRELATLIMLATIALAHASNFRQWLAGFLISFGVWDIFYYIFLRVLIGWPASLWTWDILFLLPAPWVGPVITPVLLALGMIAAGVEMLRREAGGRPVSLGWIEGSLMLLGAVVTIVAFCWEAKAIAAQAMPASFNWPLYLVGTGILAAGTLGCFVRRPAHA